MTSLKQFERKLDKLQDDVDYHGKTLNELRSLVSNLSAGTLVNPDVKLDDNPKCSRTGKSPKTNTVQQYDEVSANRNLLVSDRKKQSIQPLPSKMQEKWLVKNQGFFTNTTQKSLRCSPCYVTHKASSPTSIPVKNSTKSLKSTRLSKAEAPRKATTLRTQNRSDKMRSVINS